MEIIGQEFTLADLEAMDAVDADVQIEYYIEYLKGDMETGPAGQILADLDEAADKEDLTFNQWCNKVLREYIKEKEKEVKNEKIQKQNPK